jgi:hypothetical protein
VSNVNGLIDMRDVAGSGRAHTVNGPVTVTFPANPKQTSSFKTVNGNVDVSFPAGLAADLAMKTFNGGLFTDFDAQPLANIVAAAGERRNGKFVYRANEFTRVRVGNGRPEIAFETLNGNVRACRAGKTMRIRQCVWGLVFVLGSMPLAARQQASDRISVPLSDPSPGFIDISLVGQHHGPRHESQDLAFRPSGNRSANRRSDADATGLRRIPQSAGYKITEEGNRIKMSSDSRTARSRSRSRLSRTNLKLSTVNGGEILVENIETISSQ